MLLQKSDDFRGFQDRHIFSKEYMIPSHFSLVKEFTPSAKLISKLSSNKEPVFQMRLQFATVLGE